MRTSSHRLQKMMRKFDTEVCSLLSFCSAPPVRGDNSSSLAGTMNLGNDPELFYVRNAFFLAVEVKSFLLTLLGRNHFARRRSGSGNGSFAGGSSVEVRAFAYLLRIALRGRR